MRSLLSHYLSATEPRRLTQRLLWPVLIAGGLAVGGAAAVAWHMTTGLPSLGGLRDYQPSLITKVKADNRQVIGQFYVERRILTPLRDVPQHLINAVIAVEDTRFFDHPGWTSGAFFGPHGRISNAGEKSKAPVRSLNNWPDPCS